MWITFQKSYIFVLYCIVSIYLFSASCSAHQSEALPVRETQREESSLKRTKRGGGGVRLRWMHADEERGLAPCARSDTNYSPMMSYCLLMQEVRVFCTRISSDGIKSGNFS